MKGRKRGKTDVQLCDPSSPSISPTSSIWPRVAHNVLISSIPPWWVLFKLCRLDRGWKKLYVCDSVLLAQSQPVPVCCESIDKFLMSNIFLTLLHLCLLTIFINSMQTYVCSDMTIVVTITIYLRVYAYTYMYMIIFNEYYYNHKHKLLY